MHDARPSGDLNSDTEAYYAIQGPLDHPTNRGSAYELLLTALRREGYEIQVEGISEVLLGVYTGPEGWRGYYMARDLVPGKEIRRTGIVLQVRKAGM
jgi:hypothetical protein